MRTRHAIVDTPIGELTVVAAGDAIAGIYFPRHWTMPPLETIGERVAVGEDPLLEAAWVQLAEYLDGQRTEFDLPTRTSGSDFQERVWAILRQIPFGETTTYGAIAEELGDRALAREVGGAVGRNPLSIVVACHRVIGADGSLTGYAGGLDRKRSLLELEGAIDPEPVPLF